MATIIRHVSLTNSRPYWEVSANGVTIYPARKYCREWGRTAYHWRGLYWETLQNIVDYLEGTE